MRCEQWCSSGHTQLYGEYPLIFQSTQSLPTCKSPLILSVANHLFQDCLQKKLLAHGLLASFFVFMCGWTKE